MPPTLDVAGAATVTTAAAHGIEVAVEFKPVEHPIAPMDNGQPLQCPLPEPSILNVSLTIAFQFRNLCQYIIMSYFVMCLEKIRQFSELQRKVWSLIWDHIAFIVLTKFLGQNDYEWR